MVDVILGLFPFDLFSLNQTPFWGVQDNRLGIYPRYL
jgi:hypothetical protein